MTYLRDLEREIEILNLFVYDNLKMRCSGLWRVKVLYAI